MKLAKDMKQMNISVLIKIRVDKESMKFLSMRVEQDMRIRVNYLKVGKITFLKVRIALLVISMTVIKVMVL